MRLVAVVKFVFVVSAGSTLLDQHRSQIEYGCMLQQVLDAVPVRLFWKDRESVYLGCNHLFAADAGFASVDDVVGKTDSDMPWREQADMFRANEYNVMETKTPNLNHEESRLTSDGRTIWLRLNIVPLKDEQEHVIGTMSTYMDITEMKEAEGRQRERESIYYAMFEECSFSVALNKLSGEFVDVNDRFVHITGVSRNEAIGRTPVELGIVDELTQTFILDAVHQTGDKLDGCEIIVRTQSGETKHILLSSTLVKYKDETVILSILHDRSENRRVEAALSASEEKYRELVQDANSIILRWGRDGTIYFFNEFAQRFFGYTDEEILGRNVMDTIVPKTETSGRDLQSMIAEITARPEYHRTNVNENVRKNGERVWIAWTNKPIFNELNEITGILSVGLDITERIHDQQALQESESRYRAIFNSNVGAFILFNNTGVIVDVNERAGELYGYSREEMIGLLATDIIDPKFHHVFEDFVDTAPGEWFSWESVDVRKDDSKFDAEVHGARLLYGDHEHLLAIIFDISERNRNRESMRLFTDVVHNMQVGLYIFRLEDPSDDHTLRLMAANSATNTELGLSGSEATGKYIDEVFPDFRERGIPQLFADVVRTGEPCSMDDFAYSDLQLTPRHYSFRAFSLPGSQMGALFEDITQVVHAEDDKRHFFCKTIAAATEGKLVISDRDEIERAAGSAIATYEITRGEDLSAVRHAITAIAKSDGMDETCLFDLVLCVGEAATNALKHASQGTVSIHRHDDALLVMIADNGPGIQAINLPDVALTRGYTTAISLGLGYKVMISIADQVYLATGPDGTTVAIEMKIHRCHQDSATKLVKSL